jgi:beta-galactosidase
MNKLPILRQKIIGSLRTNKTNIYFMSNTLVNRKWKQLIILLVWMAIHKVGLGYQSPSDDHLFSATDTAGVPKEIQDPECLGIHKEADHATLMPYASLTEALAANRHASTYYINLNGAWKFHWVDWPQKRPMDFYKPGYDVSGWANITVPSCWQVQGYGTPYYSNFTYIFQKDFPRVMSTPPVGWTAYQERNPVGSYRRDFNVPKDWAGRRIFITFDGVDAGFFIWVNGQKVGYSVNSRNAAEFDLTKYVRPGNNVLAVEVYRFTTGSYLEDQDMWRLSGIFRNVSLWSAPQEHIRDFYIQTDLDENYKNAILHANAKIKNYGDAIQPARTLQVTLYDGSTPVTGATAKKPIPALQPGEEITLDVSFPVKNPEKWTAETPKLYTTVLSIGGTELVSTRTGFRRIEIKGRLFLVNGVPIKLKGVNRHENWPDDGHAITEAQMIRDIVLIKQANCNHVRTCHYSDDPRWYELCDEYGIYLVAEANLECHGSWDEFNEDPRMKAAIIERNVANVENFKNHPAVIIWSLGNECGSGGSNFRAALRTIKTIDSTRPTHYQGFGIGEKNPADMDSEMYTNLPDLLKKALDTTLVKPFYLCEYAHAMFNSMGSVDLYNDLFDKYPSLLGGAIWEWQDQGIYNDRDPGHHITAFGGGFGETPNDHYFIHKGVVFSDRSPKPHYPELKHAYQWISVKVKDFANQTFTIKNRYQFITLDGLKAHWVLTENGDSISSGALQYGRITPGMEKEVKIPYHLSPRPGAEYFLRVSFDLAEDRPWAPRGFEVAEQQIELPESATIATASPVVGALTVNETGGIIQVKGKDFTVSLDKAKGTFTSLETNGENILQPGGGPLLHLWRAPHQKDDMWAYRGWEEYGLNALTWTASDVSFTQVTPNEVDIRTTLTGTGKRNFVVHHQVVYAVYGNGVIDVINKVDFSDQQLILARLGVRMFLQKDLDRLEYLGRGPMENYADRKQGFDVGHYFSSVATQMTGYEKPMECGNHEDVRWARLSGSGQSGLTIVADSSLLQLSALPYSDEEMEKVEYKIDLPSSKGTVLCISHKTLGVGSNGCGPRPQEPYLVYAKPTTFNYQIRLVNHPATAYNH